MKVGLLSEADAQTMIKAAITSNDWWCIPWVSRAASSLAIAVEEMFYVDEAGKDFQVVATMGAIPGVSAVVLAHKRRMTPAQLADLMGGVLPVDDLVSHDILGVEDGPEDYIAEAAMVAFHDWIARA